MAKVWLGAGGPRVCHGEEELGDMGQEHQPQDVIVLYIARGEGRRTLSIKKTWERIGKTVNIVIVIAVFVIATIVVIITGPEPALRRLGLRGSSGSSSFNG